MDRRRFLAGAAGALATAVASPALAVTGSSAGSAATLLRLDAQRRHWALVDGVMPRTGTAAMRLRVLGPRLFGPALLADLQVDALYPGGAVQPLWRQQHAQTRCGSTSLRVPEQGLALSLRIQGATGPQQLIALPLGGLDEGDYLLRLDGRAETLPCADDELLPAAANVFHLQLRVEPASPALCARADLACLAATSTPA